MVGVVTVLVGAGDVVAVFWTFEFLDFVDVGLFDILSFCLMDFFVGVFLVLDFFDVLTFVGLGHIQLAFF